MRSPFLSAVLGLVSVVLLPVALVAAWVSVIATQTDVFVNETRPLIGTPSIQTALTEGAVEGVRTQVQLPPAAEQIVVPLVREGATRVVTSPQMETVWEDSMRSLHQEFTAVMEGGEPSGVDAQGRVLLAIPIAVPTLIEALLPFGVDLGTGFEPVVTFPVVSVQDLEQARTVYSLLDRAGIWAPLGVAVLGLVAILLARRRRTATMLLAAGWALVSIALGAALVLARQPLVNEVPDTVVRALANAAYGMAQRGVLTEVAAVLVIAVVLMLAVGLSSVRRRRG